MRSDERILPEKIEFELLPNSVKKDIARASPTFSRWARKSRTNNGPLPFAPLIKSIMPAVIAFNKLPDSTNAKGSSTYSFMRNATALILVVTSAIEEIVDLIIVVTLVGDVSLTTAAAI